LSTARDGWSVADHARDLAAFADALGIDSFAVWGYSGGGPYALACASLLGPRVRATAVAAGMGRVGDWATIDDFAKTDRQMLALAVRRPRLARLVMSIANRAARLSPKRALASFEKELGPPDLELLAAAGDDAVSTMALFTQAFLRGARGVVDDYRAVGSSWGFELSPPVGPVSIWHGDADTMVPVSHAQALAERLPGSTLTIWPGEGHLGTVNHVAEILDSLTMR
jgi:pimeloyl-ACP methyl ester carboxylesterase